MKKVIVLFMSIMLGACSGTGALNFSNISPEGAAGAVGGGALGGFVGSLFGGGTGQLIFIALGTLGGGGAGYAFGESLAQSDMQAFETSTQNAMAHAADGQLVNWSNPTTGVVGTVRPVRSYYAGQGYYCRDYQATVAAPEGTGVGQGRACRLGGGAWQVFG